MPVRSISAAWFKRALPVALGVLLAACASSPKPGSEQGSWSGRRLGTPPTAKPLVKRAIISGAKREWEFFGRQTVMMKGSKESIPNVGDWEDDGPRFSDRVNSYWRAVGKPNIEGADCRQPWSAAFMSWVMQRAGVPEHQFPRAPAHWMYLSRVIEESTYPGRYFVPRRVSDYSPEPGDLICAYRQGRRPHSSNGYVGAWSVRGKPAHCDLVIEKDGARLVAIGGNVRNSVSKVELELDGAGHLQGVPRRPWFLVLENRL